MGRASFRRRVDGIHEIVPRQRARTVALALGTALASLLMLMGAAAAMARQVVLGVPLAVCGAAFLGWRARRPRETARPVPPPTFALRVVEPVHGDGRATRRTETRA